MRTSPGPRYLPTITSTPATVDVSIAQSIDHEELTSSNDVAVLDHNTLGGASGARGVHDAGKVVGLGRDGLGRVVIAERDQLVEADNPQVGMRAGESVDVPACTTSCRSR